MPIDERWFPHIHSGGTSGECISDEESGREGRYLDICWLGFMVSISFSSIYAERRLMACLRAEREASPQ